MSAPTPLTFRELAASAELPQIPPGLSGFEAVALFKRIIYVNNLAMKTVYKLWSEADAAAAAPDAAAAAAAAPDAAVLDAYVFDTDTDPALFAAVEPQLPDDTAKKLYRQLTLLLKAFLAQSQPDYPRYVQNYILGRQKNTDTTAANLRQRLSDSLADFKKNWGIRDPVMDTLADRAFAEDAELSRTDSLSSEEGKRYADAAGMFEGDAADAGV